MGFFVMCYREQDLSEEARGPHNAKDGVGWGPLGLPNALVPGKRKVNICC
jgi:hypothetical protein